jgi:hypothetical protein
MLTQNFFIRFIATYLPNFENDTAADMIFEMGDKVAKVKGNAKGKRKVEGVEDGAGSRGKGKEQAHDVKVDWASMDRLFRGTG